MPPGDALPNGAGTLPCTPDVAFGPRLCETSQFAFSHDLFWKFLPHLLLAPLDLLSPRRLYGTIFSKMKPSKRFRPAWAISGLSLCETDQREHRTHSNTFMVGNAITARIEGLSVITIASRSTPTPSPPIAA